MMFVNSSCTTKMQFTLYQLQQFNIDHSLTTTYMLTNCELNCLSFLFLFQNDKRLMSLLINEAKGERVTIPCSFVAFVLHNGLQNDHRNYSLLTALSNCYSRQFFVVWYYFRQYYYMIHLHVLSNDLRN